MSLINNPIYYPLLSSRNLNGGVLSQEEFNDIWTRFDGLTPENKAKVGSKKMPEKIERFQKLFQTDDQNTESLSVLVRSLFFGQIDLVFFRDAVSRLTEKFSPGKSQEALTYVQKEIIELEPEKDTPAVVENEELNMRPSQKMVMLPLLQALSQYQQLGNQMITQERIRLKAQGEPVRPSLFNWIKYYRDELGVGFHDSVQRGNFLFRSENGKRLSEEERERVNIILRSIEEEFPVQVDTASQEIVFPEMRRKPEAFPLRETPSFQGAAPGPAITRGPAFAAPGMQGGSASVRQGESTPLPPQKADFSKKPSSMGNLSFSFNHVLPAEKEKLMIRKEEQVPQAPSQPPLPPLAPKLPPKPIAEPPQKMGANPFHIRPVSLSQDEEKR